MYQIAQEGSRTRPACNCSAIEIAVKSLVPLLLWRFVIMEGVRHSDLLHDAGAGLLSMEHYAAQAGWSSRSQQPEMGTTVRAAP